MTEPTQKQGKKELDDYFNDLDRIASQPFGGRESEAAKNIRYDLRSLDQPLSAQPTETYSLKG